MAGTVPKFWALSRLRRCPGGVQLGQIINQCTHTLRPFHSLGLQSQASSSSAYVRLGVTLIRGCGHFKLGGVVEIFAVRTCVPEESCQLCTGDMLTQCTRVTHWNTPS